MKRKRFLQIIAGGVALSAIPGVWFLRKDAREAAIHLILSELSYLKLDKKGVEAFADDYVIAHKSSLFKNEVKVVDILGLSASRLGHTEILVKDYLLSSTFFRNKMDETRLVEYTGVVYNPFKVACSNPFSFIYYPENSHSIANG